MIPTQHQQRSRYIAFPGNGGAVSEVRFTREDIAELKITNPQWKDALDVTPNECVLQVHIALGINTWWQRCATSVRCFPCSKCNTAGPSFTVCDECGGSRRMPTIAWVMRK